LPAFLPRAFFGFPGGRTVSFRKNKTLPAPHLPGPLRHGACSLCPHARQSGPQGA
jgi:hypothetical protein